MTYAENMPKDATHLASTIFGWVYAKQKRGKWVIYSPAGKWVEPFTQSLETKKIDAQFLLMKAMHSR